MDWDKLRIFRAVAADGNLTRAGESLGLHQSAVSRQIRALEHSLSTSLFHRHARGLILTEQGELLRDATESMAHRLDFAVARIRDTREVTAGELRVTTTAGFGMLWLAPRLANFYEIYPDISINLMLEERILDLPMREADFAIRMKEPSQADVIRRKLLDVRMCLYATNEYLARHGVPATREELTDHRLIWQNFEVETGAGASFIKDLLQDGILPGLTVNNYYGVLQGVIHHLGIGVLPDYLSVHFPELVHILPQTCSPVVPVYLAYPVELRNSKKIQAFRDFILKEAKLYRMQEEASGQQLPVAAGIP